VNDTLACRLNNSLGFVKGCGGYIIVLDLLLGGGKALHFISHLVIDERFSNNGLIRICKSFIGYKVLERDRELIRE
jgi:hypothetical protein